MIQTVGILEILWAWTFLRLEGGKDRGGRGYLELHEYLIYSLHTIQETKIFNPPWEKEHHLHKCLSKGIS